MSFCMQHEHPFWPTAARHGTRGHPGMTITQYDRDLVWCQTIQGTDRAAIWLSMKVEHKKILTL